MDRHEHPLHTCCRIARAMPNTVHLSTDVSRLVQDLFQLFGAPASIQPAPNSTTSRVVRPLLAIDVRGDAGTRDGEPVGGFVILLLSKSAKPG